MIENNELIKAFRLCIMAIEALHPKLDPDEPCIAFEAYEAATYCSAMLQPPNKPLKQMRESRCPQCGETEPVLCCENCGHKWSRTAYYIISNLEVI